MCVLVFCAQIIAIDMNRENYQLGAPVIERAGLSHKIDFREGLILPQLDEMLQEVSQIQRNLSIHMWIVLSIVET